jgi:hypothetical protein
VACMNTAGRRTRGPQQWDPETGGNGADVQGTGNALCEPSLAAGCCEAEQAQRQTPKRAGASNEAAPCSAGPRGGGARLEQGMVCRPCWSPCAGMAGFTLIAQRPQRRGEQHNNIYRAWASIVGTLPSPGLAGYRSRQISRPIDFPMGSRSLPMGSRSLPLPRASLSFLVKQPGGLGCKLHSKCSKCCLWAADPSAAIGD